MIYFDHAATTEIDPEVLKKMLPYLKRKYGNPSSIYAMGREARLAIEAARTKVADKLGEKNGKIIFTSGGTEANNWAVFGIAEAYSHPGAHVITTRVEHPSVLRAFEQLERRGFRVTYLQTDRFGQVEPRQLEKECTKETIFASIIYANNEIGTVQRMKEISQILKQKKIIFHTDACQAPGNIPINVNELGVDAMTINSGKVYGPKGVGALYIGRGVKIAPLLYGGGQEFRMRAGTENVAGIVGFSEALELAKKRMNKDIPRITGLRDEAIRFLTAIPGVTLNGHRTQRLPNNINVSISGANGESLIMRLDMEGIAVSSGSACTSGSIEPSHVLRALGLKQEHVKNSLRISLGRENTKAELHKALRTIAKIIGELRKIENRK